MGGRVASGGESGPERVEQVGTASNGSNVHQAGRDVNVYGPGLHVPVWTWAAVSVAVLVAATAVTWATWPRPATGPSALDTERPMATSLSAWPSPGATTTATRPPTATTTPAPATVWWTGNLKLGGYGGTGGGWWLDRNPPSQAVTGDLYYQSENEVAGVAVVRWDGAAPPDLAQCATVLNADIGRTWTAVRLETMACLRTRDGRVGYFTVTRISGPNELTPSISVLATVWDTS